MLPTPRMGFFRFEKAILAIVLLYIWGGLLAGCPLTLFGNSGQNTVNTPPPGGSSVNGLTGALTADHNSASAFGDLSDTALAAVRISYQIFYGHTSHGSQIVTGMEMLAETDARYNFNAGSGTLGLEEISADLGGVWDLPDQPWVTTTREVLNQADSDINLVMWSWCGGVSDNTEQGITAYLEAMNRLENDYPAVVFIYMTGHLDGTGPNGNLRTRNNQIRQYCQSHGKILFDFADIESYDPDGNYHAWGSDWCEWCEDWCATHSCPTCAECAHSVCFNCYQKGRAFWWLLAQIAGE
ncbi:MAG: hypothetical protein ABIG44_18200 [Planctomycetota bacterium]